MSRLKSKRGSIFILVMWTLFLLTIYALGLGRKIQQDINLASYHKDQLRARYLAEAGFKNAQSILDSDDNDFDALNEFWSKGSTTDDTETVFKDIVLGDGTYSFISKRIDPKKHDEEDVSASDEEEESEELVEYGLVDEERKISINKASEETLEGLFIAIAELDRDTASIIANSIIDFRDTDGQTRVDGAEDQYYQLLGNPYPCKNSDFEVLEELLLVRGITHEIFRAIKDHVTVYGDGKININTASEETLLSLGMSGLLVDKVLNFRDGPDNIVGTEDDQIFEAASKILDDLSVGIGLFEKERTKIEQLVTNEVLKVNSQNYSVYIEAKMGRRLAKVKGILTKEKGLQYWYEL